jgi:hypothetical protein
VLRSKKLSPFPQLYHRLGELLPSLSLSPPKPISPLPPPRCFSIPKPANPNEIFYRLKTDTGPLCTDYTAVALGKSDIVIFDSFVTDIYASKIPKRAKEVLKCL